MRGPRGSLRLLAAALLAALFAGGASANAFEAHNALEPPFGEFRQIGVLSVDASNGNVYGAQLASQHEAVLTFGREGGTPAEGVPTSFTSPQGTQPFRPVGLAVEPSTHDVLVADGRNHTIERFALNGSGAYEEVCEIKYIGAGDRCLPGGGSESESTESARLVGFENEGLAFDALGDLYTEAQLSGGVAAIVELNPADEVINVFALPPLGEEEYVYGTGIATNGTIYAFIDAGPPYIREVLELKRSSPTGAVEGAPVAVPGTLTGYFSPERVTGLAFDRATGQLFLAFGTFVEAFDEAHTMTSRFGAGLLAAITGVAVNEATGEVYVANGGGEDIYRFGPGVPATLPQVDAPSPSLSNLTRTSGLLSGTIETGDATTQWHLEYVIASEYQPASANPYAAGGSTGSVRLAPSATGTGVGPVPLTGLLAGTTYHYRLLASNELGTTYGSDHTFTTAATTPPTASTGAASEVTQTSATLSGTVGTQELPTSYELEVGTDTSYAGAKLFGNAGSGGTVAVSQAIQFLIPGVTYHYRVVAHNEDGTTYGQDMTFTTPGVPPGISQPSTEALLATQVGAFPSVAGAITKGENAGAKVKHKKSTARKRSTAKRRRRRSVKKSPR